jgi:hypothetical protein
VLPLHIEPEPDDPELASLFVDGSIDGRPYRLLLDTGAAQSWVAADEYTSTLEVVGEKQSKGVFSATLTDELVVLGRLSIGPIEKTNLTVVRFTGTGRPSLVGMDALGGTTLVVDFDRSEVRFAPGGSLPTSWPLRRSPRGHPYLDVQLPGVVGLACWDTGAAVTQVNTAFVAENSSLFTPIGASVGTDSTGASHETPMYRMAAATAGGITLAAHTVATVPLPQDPMPMDLVLGYPALRQFNWTMDLPRSRWSATPASWETTGGHAIRPTVTESHQPDAS